MRRPASPLVYVAALLLSCGPKNYATRSVYLEAAQQWARAEQGRSFEALVEGAEVLALGEVAHGARDVFIERAEMTQRLIRMGWARALIIEADASDVCVLEKYIQGDGNDLRGALLALPGLYGHDDSETFFSWLREHNEGSAFQERVHVHGMDAQSLSACQENRSAPCGDREKWCGQVKALQRAPELGETYWGRDEIMAENVMDVVERTAGGVIVWAHSGHVSKSPPLLFNGLRRSTAPMGWFLSQELGARYRSMSVTFQRGSVTIQALRGGVLRQRLGSVGFISLQDAPPETVEGTVSGEGRRPVLLDLKSLPQLAESTAWFASPQFTRSIGAVERAGVLRRSAFARGWSKYVMREAFDYLLVLPSTRPIHFWFAEAG